MTSHWKNDICSRNCRKNYCVNHLTSNPLGTGLPNIDSQLINNDIHFLVFYSQYRVKIIVPFFKTNILLTFRVVIWITFQFWVLSFFVESVTHGIATPPVIVARVSVLSLLLSLSLFLSASRKNRINKRNRRYVEVGLRAIP